MGFLRLFLIRRYGQKYWIYVMDWIVDIFLGLAFIYLSLQTREYMLHCECPFCAAETLNASLINISNITNKGTPLIKTP